MESFDYGPATRDELRVLQFVRLRETLEHAYRNVEHYRQEFDKAGLKPNDLRTLADLARFPFTTKAHLRAYYPFGMFAVPDSQVARIHASSGTTGKPTVVGYTARDIEIWAGLVARSLHAAGLRPGMRVHVAYGYGLFTGGLGAHYGAEALGCNVIPMSGGQTERQVQLICDFKPDAILVTPSYMLTILDEFRRQGIDPRSSSLRYGVFGAEPWTESMRREIEDSFNLKASDIYGLSEIIGPGVGCEFAGGAPGPTLWEDHFYPEIIDPETGAVLPDGEEGELVFTSLAKEAMPIIRYRTRDLTRLLPPSGGTPMRRMAKIVSRSDDMLIVRGVNLFPTQIEELVLRCEGLSPHFLLRVTRPERLDEVAVHVEARADLDPGLYARQSGQLALYVKERIGVTATIVIEPPGALARSVGKAVRVEDLRKL